MDLTPIAQLGPSLTAPESKRIHAIVTLIWPYSSYTRSTALLLVEPDFRLRNKRGQIRVQLRGASAEALARSKIGSGDEIILNLEGSKWVEATPGISTPGKSVDVELLYRRRLVCQISRDGHEVASIEVDHDTPSEIASRSPSPSTPFEPSYAFATPTIALLNTLATPASSAFHKRARVSSGPLVDSPYDPFVNELRRPGEPERKRLRRSWANDTRWKLTDQLPSPTKSGSQIDWLHDGESDSSPRKSYQKVGDDAPIEVSVSHLDQPSLTAPKAIAPQIEEIRNRYTQELMDTEGGDTEEDTHFEVPSSPRPIISHQKGSSYGNQSQSGDQPGFAVFRDEPLVEYGSLPRERSISISERVHGMPELADAVSVLEYEDQFLDLSANEDHRETEETIERDQHIVQEATDTFISEGHIDPALMGPPASLNMPPPGLPLIQTSGLDSSQSTSIGPPSALPGSPRTPDLRPQQSATLPLPSPFPGDDLATSYMDPFGSQNQPRDFMRLGPPGIVPDHVLQFGFGFDSARLVRSQIPDAQPAISSGFPGDAHYPTRTSELELEHPALGQPSDHISYPELELPQAEIPFVAGQVAEPQAWPSGQGIQQDYQIDMGQNAAPFGQPATSSSIYPPLEVPEPNDPATLSSYINFQHQEEEEEEEEESVEAEEEDEGEDEEEEDEDEDEDEEDEGEDKDEDEDEEEEVELEGEEVGADSRFGPPTNESNQAVSVNASSDLLPPKSSAPIVIDLLYDSESEQSKGDESQLESVDGDAEDVQRGSSEVSEDYDEEISDDHAELVELDEDREDEELSELEEPEDHDQKYEEEWSSPGPRSDGVEMIEQIPSLDGTIDVPPGLYSTAPPGHGDTTSASPLLLASTASRREAVVIDLGSENESESEDEPGKQVVDLQGPTAATEFKSESMEDAGMADVPKPEHGEQIPVVSHSIVNFAPRVARRRAAIEARSSADLEPQSSAPLASSQDSIFRKPRLIVQDTFESMIHSDGSLTSAHPSDRGESDMDNEEHGHKHDSSETQRPTVVDAGLNETQYSDNLIPSSPPLPSSDQDDSASGRPLYPKLPLAVEGGYLDSQQRFTQHGQIAGESARESNLPMTPDASQQASFTSQHLSQAAQQHSALPPTPQMTQTSFNQSFASQMQDKQVQIAQPEMEQVKELVTQRLKQQPPSSQRHSDIMSPWFGPRASTQRYLSSSPPPDNEALTEVSETLVLERSELEVKKSEEKHQNGSSSSLKLQEGGSKIAQDSALLSIDAEQSLLKHVRKELLAPSSQVQQTPKTESKPAEESEEEIQSSQLSAYFSFSQSQSSQTKGLLTSLSYYTPLSNLITHLYAQSSQSHYDSGIDVLAVVSKSTTQPLRADKGPRDYYTTFSITDTVFWPRSVRVQVFRPWKAALPKAEKGDIVLLRSFEAFSAKGNVGVALQSGEGGAWCVWRFGPDAFKDEGLRGDGVDIAEQDLSQPAWAKREGRGEKSLAEREDIRGPPVEIGEEEREHAGSLRDWWLENETASKKLGNGHEDFSQGVDSVELSQKTVA